MTNTRNEYYPVLDYLRAMAALWVVFYHSPFNPIGSLLLNWARFGALGVDLFFVLSGFLISNQLFLQIEEHKTFRLKTFYIKRALRIWPAYYFLIILFCILGYGLGMPSYKISPLLSYLTLTQNYLTTYYFSVSWSLCIEEHFYLIFPLIILLLLKLKCQTKYWVSILFLFIFIEFIFRAYYWSVHRIDLNFSMDVFYKYFYNYTHVRLAGLIAGVVIAGLKNFHKELWNKIALLKWWMPVICLMLLYLGVSGINKLDGQFGFYATVFSNFITAISFGCLTIFALQFKKGMNNFLHKFLSLTSILSYSIYLTHIDVYKFCESILGGQRSYLSVIISTALIYLTGYALYRLVELPFMKFRRRL